MKLLFAFFFYSLAAPALALAEPITEQSVVLAYAQNVASQYQAAVDGALTFQRLVQAFLDKPNGQTLRAAREQWIEMRKAYSSTEVFRFYGGPIDGDNGPEGLINSWPLDEAYIDYVVGAGNSGIINDTTRYPTITKDLLESLNEQAGEKSISVGYHAIEFLLWGQDLSSTSAGNRNFTDYVVGKGKNADRRREYLRLATELLVEKLQGVSEQWNPNSPASYAAGFLQESEKESLRRMLTGVYRMAGEELSQERMFVAYDTQAQEDEHSCFSDTTHLDILYNFLGLKNVLDGKGTGGPLALVREKNSALAQEIEAQLTKVEQAIRAIPMPFDNAIYSESGRAAILESVHALEDLAQQVKQAGMVLGLELN